MIDQNPKMKSKIIQPKRIWMGKLCRSRSTKYTENLLPIIKCKTKTKFFTNLRMREIDYLFILNTLETSLAKKTWSESRSLLKKDY